MSDVIARMRLESQDFDNKLKSATANLQHMEREVRRTGATFEYADKEELEFLQSLGQMQTKAIDSSGKLKELTKSFTELSIVYKNMTEEEKKSAPGQALAGSIDQIKGRIGELKGQIGDVGQELNGSKGMIDGFADALSQLGPAGQMAGKLLKGAFGPVGIAIAAVVGIIQQLVSAFKRNEDAMAGAARAAAPFKAIWQQIQQLFDRLVPYIAKGMETIANGMQSLFSKITDWMGKLSQTSIGKKLGLDKVYEQLKKVSSAQAELTESNKKIADSENALNKMRRSTETGNTQRRAQIAELRFKASDKTNYSAEERVGFLEKAQELEGKTLQANLALRQKEYELIKLKNSLTKSGTEDLDAENAALNAITDARTEYNEHLRSTQRQLESARKESTKEASGVGGGSKQDSAPAVGSLGDWEQQAANVREYMKGATSTEEYKELQTDLDFILSKIKEIQGTAEVAFAPGSLNDLNQQLSEAQSILASLAPNTEEWANALQEVADKQAAVNALQEQINSKGGSGVDNAKGTADAWQNAVAAVNNVGSALQQIEDPAAKVSGIVMQAIANVALGFAQASASAATGAAGVFGWIAAATAGVATMVSTIAAIKSATSGSYASGGIIPGNSFSGDNLTANVNSGELILNRAQQGAIAGQLQGAAQQTVVVEGRISGKDILLSANNTNRAAGGSRGFYTKVK